MMPPPGIAVPARSSSREACDGSGLSRARISRNFHDALYPRLQSHLWLAKSVEDAITIDVER